MQHISDLHSKFALSHTSDTMCRSMVDIQSATPEIRREKKKEGKRESKKERRNKNIMSASAAHGGPAIIS